MKYIVIDEAHIYNGVFGGHFAMILRRLKRIYNLYNSSSQKKVQFIACSATLGHINPMSFYMKLIDEDESNIKVITNDGSPISNKTIAIWSGLYEEIYSKKKKK